MSTHAAAESAHSSSTTRTHNGNSSHSSRLGSSAETVFSLVAVLALTAVFALAFFNNARPSRADKITLLVLALLGAVFFWTPLFRFFDRDEAHVGEARVDDWEGSDNRNRNANRDEAACFALSLAMFVVYALARAAGPDGENAWSLHFALLPTTAFPVSWAARVVVVGALATTPLWLKKLNNWTRAVLCALGVVTFFGVASFSFLREFYPVGESDAVLDPKPLADTMMQVVEYSALALVCCAACVVSKTRRLVLRVLPLLLLALWARHQWFPAPPPPEDDE